MSGDNGDTELRDEQVARSIARKLKTQSSTTEALDPFRLKARFIAQSIHPYMDLTTIFLAVTPEAVVEEENEPFEHEMAELDAFNAIMALQRGFRQLVGACAEDAAAFTRLIKTISDASASSRNDDVSSLKSNIVEYMPEDIGAQHRLSFEWEYTPLKPSSKKGSRGWNHIETADFLCPLRLKVTFDEDPHDFIARVTENEIMITADDLPSFLYADGTMYNPKKICDGLFRGHLIVRVYRHIFTALSSALDPNEKVNKSKARIFKITTVTPRTIAYAAVQRGWCTTVRVFDLAEFYNTIVDIFETNKDTQWALETLQWFNVQVPGLRVRHAKSKRNAADCSAPRRAGPTLAQRIANQLGVETAPPARPPANNIVNQPRRHQPATEPPGRDKGKDQQRTAGPLTPRSTNLAMQQIETPTIQQHNDLFDFDFDINIERNDNRPNEEVDDEPQLARITTRSRRSQMSCESEPEDDADLMDMYDDSQSTTIRRKTPYAADPNEEPPRSATPAAIRKAKPTSKRPLPLSTRMMTRSATTRSKKHSADGANSDEGDDDLPLARKKKKN